MSKEAISKVYLVVEKIEYIEQIVTNSGNITTALNDEVTVLKDIRKQRVLFIKASG